MNHPGSTVGRVICSGHQTTPFKPIDRGRHRSAGEIDAGGQAQIFEMTVHGGKGAQSSLEVLPVPEQYRWSPAQAAGPSTNVAQSYARFARDYREGTHFCPTFDDAVTRHRMLNAIETAAVTGQRQTLG